MLAGAPSAFWKREGISEVTLRFVKAVRTIDRVLGGRGFLGEVPSGCRGRSDMTVRAQANGGLMVLAHRGCCSHRVEFMLASALAQVSKFEI